MASTETRTQLVACKVTGLLGTHDFEFELDPDEPTLLTGSNGSGKSTILRAIDAVFAGRWGHLAQLPFSSLQLSLSHGAALRIAKRDDGLRVQQGNRSWTYDPKPAGGLPRAGTLRYSLPTWADIETQSRTSARIDSSGPLYATLANLYQAEPERPVWVEEIPNLVPVLFVTDQRLVLDSPKDSESSRKSAENTSRIVVDHAVEHIQGLMSQALSTYAAESQRLDRDFPTRVIQAMRANVDRSDRDLDELLSSNEVQANLLQSVGLLPEDVQTQAYIDFIADNERPVIATHADDTARKLQALGPLQRRLSLFSRFLNDHYRTKQITFDPAFGFRIKVGSSSLSPNQLSSGEQQILVLAYQILFNAEQGTLLLIDEPELSLHVTWQSSFIDDMAIMGAERDLRFLLATHSPTLIGGRDDLRRNLDSLS